MSGKGKWIAAFTILAAAAGIVLGIANVQADIKAQVLPRTNDVINYPAFPDSGGPHIIAATYRNFAGGTDVFVVFNEDLDTGEVDLTGPLTNDDFYVQGFDYTAVATGPENNAIRFTGVSNFQATVAYVRMTRAGVIRGQTVHPVTGTITDTSWNSDVSPFYVGTGPVATSVRVVQPAIAEGDSSVTYYSIMVHWDSAVALVGTAAAAFQGTLPNGTPVFDGSTLSVAGAPGQDWTITRTGGRNWSTIFPGVSLLRVAQGQVRWNQSPNNVSSETYWVPFKNEPPHLIGAYYNDNENSGPLNDVSDDALWLVFSQPILPSSITDGLGGHFLTDPDAGGDWTGLNAPTDGLITAAFAGDWSASWRITNFAWPDSGVPTPPDSSIDRIGSVWSTGPGVDDNGLKNYQDLAPTTENETRNVRIDRGPGIIRASYDDNRTPTDYTDDKLYVWLSETIAGLEQLPLADRDVIVDSYKRRFNTWGYQFALNNPSVLVTADSSGTTIERVVFSGFSATNHPRPGYRIRPLAPLADPDSTIRGSKSGKVLAHTYWFPIEDESRPSQLQMVENVTHTVAVWQEFPPAGVTGDVDSVYCAWGEGGADDAGQYFAFISSIDGDVDAPSIRQLMSNHLGRAIPLGNLHPQGTDDLIKVCFPLTVLPASPPGTPNPFILGTDPNDRIPAVADPSSNAFYVYIAAADLQGNVANWGDPYGIHKFNFNLWPEPVLALRTYIQPEVCPAVDGAPDSSNPAPAAIPNTIGLFALQEQLDYDVQAVRFEYFHDASNDSCATTADTWTVIGTDVVDNPTGGETPSPAGDAWFHGGDAVLYRSTNPGEEPDALQLLVRGTAQNPPYPDASYALQTTGAGPGYRYWDFPNQNGYYDPLDAVVYDTGTLNQYNAADDQLVIANGITLPEGVVLSNFQDGEYWAEAYGETDGLESTDWILRQNPMNDYPLGDLEPVRLWYMAWDISAIPNTQSNFLVRAVAQDNNGIWDVPIYICLDPAQNGGHIANPPEVERVVLDRTTPSASGLTVQAFFPNTTLSGLSSMTVSSFPTTDIFPGRTMYMKISAAATGADYVAFSKSFPTGILDDNEDDDWYVSLDGTLGYQKDNGPEADGSTDDEVIRDVNADGMYDAGDIVLYAGRNHPTVDTPLGTYLLPLIAEDPADGVDNDGDNLIDEDGVMSDAGPPVTYRDETEPFEVYWDMVGSGVDLPATTAITFTATPARDTCPGGLIAGTTLTGTINIRENGVPEGLVRLANLRNIGQDSHAELPELDIWPTVSDGDGYGSFGADVDSMLVFVTASDALSLVHNVRLFYRAEPGCNTAGPTQWTFVSDAVPNTFYPNLPDHPNPHIQLDWHVKPLPDGAYQFFAMVADSAGNFSMPPAIPYGFGKHEEVDSDYATIYRMSTPSGTDSAAVGDWAIFQATAPDTSSRVGVSFYYAERIVDEAIDATLINPQAPFYSRPLSLLTVREGPDSNGVVLTINGSRMAYGVDYNLVRQTNAGPPPVDYDIVEFTTRPADDDVILISYNVTPYMAINTGDGPHQWTVEWEPPAGVPAPVNPGVTAYDLIARAIFDVNGDGVFSPNGPCDFQEGINTEETYLYLLDLDLPGVVLYGLSRSPMPGTIPDPDYPDFNRPGNPVFRSVAGNVANKLSGVETDLFAVAADPGGAGISEVWADVTAHTGEGDQTTTLNFTEYTYAVGANTIMIPVTFYPTDYPAVFTVDRLENVTVVTSDGQNVLMAEQADGSYLAEVAVHYSDAGATTLNYTFMVDLVGDTLTPVPDARNNNGATPTAVSSIVVPKAPFWYYHVDNEATGSPFVLHAVHDVTIYAKDDSPQHNVGTNWTANIPAGEFMAGNRQLGIEFIYDTVAPTVQDISVMPDPTNMVDGTQIVVTAQDPNPPNPSVITIAKMYLQYRVKPANPADPLSRDVWLTSAVDVDPSNGWIWNGWTPANAPDNDGYDNDNNGLTDDPAEKVFTYPIRAVPVDDGMNHGYSDAQGVTASVTIDNSPPIAWVTSPTAGTLFNYGDMLNITAHAQSDTAMNFAATDVASVRFQYKDGRYAWLDNGGHADIYDSGTDAVFRDEDGDGTWTPGTDTAIYTPDGYVWPAVPTAAMVWFDIDPTPVDNSDMPVVVPDADGNAAVAFDTNQFWGVLDPQGPQDTYVYLRAIAKDTAGNEAPDNQLYRPQLLIIMNDNTAPGAFVTALTIPGLVGDRIASPVDTLRINIDGTVTVKGTYTPQDLTAYVSVYYEAYTPAGGTPIMIGVDNAPAGGNFAVNWTANPALVPEGLGQLWALVTDIDQNQSDPATAIKVWIYVDKTPPTAEYDQMAFVVGEGEYANDDLDPNPADDTSLAIIPDPDTGDVFFYVTTTAPDAATVTLKWALDTEPQGVWHAMNTGITGFDGMLDPEANLDFDGNHVWRGHVEDFKASALPGFNGKIRFRATVTDLAGLANVLQTDYVVRTVDTDNPTGFDWTDDSATNHIDLGGEINFHITATDATTDVVQMVLYVMEVGSGDPWEIVDGGPVTAHGLDTIHALWTADFTWTAPDFVVRDTQFNFKVRMKDTAGNWVDWNWPSNPVVVEDHIAPDRTKIVNVAARVRVANDKNDGQDLPAGGWDPSCLTCNDFVWLEIGGADNSFTPGVDIALSTGTRANIPAGHAFPADSIAWYGAMKNTFPRMVDEDILSQTPSQTVKVNHTVMVVARTQADDEGIVDSGIGFVQFYAQRVNADGTPYEGADPILLGKDEHAPMYPLYTWLCAWDLDELMPNGDRMFPSDSYWKLWAAATDEAGNPEVAPFDQTAAVIHLDTEAPIAKLTIVGAKDDGTAERNSAITLKVQTYKADGTTPENYEDDDVTFYLKRERDLAETADSYTFIQNAWGVGPEDGNPDLTRPYSFDLQLGLASDRTGLPNMEPLRVGEQYEFVPAVEDEVGNQTSQIAARMAGDRHATVTIVDTQAPHLEITEAVRAVGDVTAIPFPTDVHAQAFASITAKLLSGDLDMDRAEFVYRRVGDTTWNLIDADLVPSDHNRVWVLGAWDLQTLEHNTWYEVAVRGVDDVGNVDQNPDIMRVYVDYEAPDFAIIDPVNTPFTMPGGDEVLLGDKLCWGVKDLVVELTTRGPDQEHDDVWNVQWYWKNSADADTSTMWMTTNVAGWTYDDVTNRYSSTINLTSPTFASQLYDLQVKMWDTSGNVTAKKIYKNVVDLNAPNRVWVSNIKWQGMDTTQNPIDQGQCADVTAGTMVTIFGTASDDETGLPNAADPITGVFYETLVDSMQFQVAFDDDGPDEWHDLGARSLSGSMGDISAQTDSVLWNTTGLPEGQYWVRVGARDECGHWAWSDPANVCINDNIPPIARIVCMNTRVDAHGEPPRQLMTLYAMAESDPDEDYDVQFQYKNVDTPDVPWTNIGIGVEHEWDCDFEPLNTQHLWEATVDPKDLHDSGIQKLWLRALVKDDAGNRYGDNPGDVVPVLQADLVMDDIGNWVLVPESPATPSGAQVVQEVNLKVTGQSNESHSLSVTVEVKMVDAVHTPRMTVLAWEIEHDHYNLPGHEGYDYMCNYSPEVDDIGLKRSVNPDEANVWRTAVNLNWPDYASECYSYKICVSGLDVGDDYMWVDLKGKYANQYFVNQELGTNGMVKTFGYYGTPDLYATAEITGGSMDASDFEEGCLFIGPTMPPLVSHDQGMYLKPVEKSAWHMEMVGQYDNFKHGYEPLFTYDVSKPMADLALAGMPNADYSDLTVRRWNSSYSNFDGTNGAWVGTGISHIMVDTTGMGLTGKLQVKFRVDELQDHSYSKGNVFQVFAPKANPPVDFVSVWPNSPYLGADWQTNASPTWTIYLRDPSGQPVNPYSVEVQIDDRVVASWAGGTHMGGHPDQILDGSEADLDCINADCTIWVLDYHHSYMPKYWLPEGQHTITVRYAPEDGTDEWLQASQVFWVDQSGPYIAFDGGWVQNPRLINLAGYMNPANNTLTAKIYDGGTGVLFKHGVPWFMYDTNGDGILDLEERTQEPSHNSDHDYIPIDWSLKCDVWVMNNEDNQHDIDEIEQRTLLNTITANTMEPWVKHIRNGSIPDVPSWKFGDYVPMADTLVVPVVTLGGMPIVHDGSIIEVVWYSDKLIEQWPDGFSVEMCGVDTLMVNGQIIRVPGSLCGSVDMYSQEMHIYTQGVTDWAWNWGSKYVEQRFIVDMSGPVCNIVQPPAKLDPKADMVIDVSFADLGAGMAADGAVVTVTDPEGGTVELSDVNQTANRFTAMLHGPLAKGQYVVHVTSVDMLGNASECSRTVTVESDVLTISAVRVYPNPFNPGGSSSLKSAGDANATISYELSRPADVMVKIYDFNGRLVWSERKNGVPSGQAGTLWGGTTPEGTALANGPYICRITASDGVRTESTEAKLVIWRD